MTQASEDPFNRQRLVDGWRQDALATAAVIVAGVGALGNEVAKNLALAGVGRLVLCDPDAVEPTNLSRAVLFRPSDVGRPKVDAARDALQALAPATTVDVRQARLTVGVGLGELADAGVVVGCLDSLRARLELLGRVALVDGRLVDGGTGPWSGEVRVRTSHDGPCYACTLSVYERGVSDIPRSCAELEPGSPAPAPASIATTALVASWMSVAALRLIMGLDVPYNGLRLDAVTGVGAPVTFTSDPSCLYHFPLPDVDEHVAVTPADSVADFLARVGSIREVTAWVAFPISPQCLRCGRQTRYDQTQSMGMVTQCMRCGAAVRPQTSVDLVAADPSATLGSLGVAPQEILRARMVDGVQRWVRIAG